MSKCSKEEEMVLLKANNRSTLLEQRKVMQKVKDLEIQLKKSNRGHVINRVIMILFGFLGLAFQIYLQVIKG